MRGANCVVVAGASRADKWPATEPAADASGKNEDAGEELSGAMTVGCSAGEGRRVCGDGRRPKTAASHAHERWRP